MIDHVSMLSVKKAMSGGHFHAVRFYDSEAALCRIVASFLREGLAMGQPALVIATPEHSLGIVAELRARELDINTLNSSDMLVVLDAAGMIAAIVVDGVPDAAKFQATVTAAFD